jgi:hypothetical protein
MGWFLRSRFVTHLSVLVGFLLATCSFCPRSHSRQADVRVHSLSTFYYAWSISRSWPAPTNFTKVIRVFAMVRSPASLS